MAKQGKEKKSCEKYKLEGHYEKNKQLKKERNEKRIEKFRKRREKLEQNMYDMSQKNNDSINNDATQSTRFVDEFSKMRSIFAKLKNEIDAEKKAEKNETEKNRYTKKRQKDEYVEI